MSVNEYDAAVPAGQETTPEGHLPRVRRAVPGSALDEVYASRYRLLGVTDVDGVAVALEVEDDPQGPPPLTDEQQDVVAQAIADETPPDARRRRKE